MPPRPNRPAAPLDPLRQPLKDIRKGLLRLHKALLDAERATHERRAGALSNAQFLQALLHDPHFAWLRPFSGLVVEIDEALGTREPLEEAQAQRFVQQALALVAIPAEGSATPSRYDELRQREPSVLFAHVELIRHLSRLSGSNPSPS